MFAKEIIVAKQTFFIDNFGAQKRGSIAYKTGPNGYRKVKDT